MKLVASLLAGLATALSAMWCPLEAQGGVIHSDAAPLWGANVRLVPTVTVGVLDGPPEYAFGSVNFVVGEKSGGFFVHDSKYAQIRRYNAAGKLIANIGGKGAGPGEYQDLLGMALVGDSALVTWDPRNARVTFFGLDGKVRSSFRPMLGGMTYASDVFGIDHAGVVFLQSGFGETRKYVRYRSNGTLLDTIPAAEGTGGAFVLMTTDGSRFSFVTTSISKPSPSGGLVSAVTSMLGFTMTVAGKGTTVQRAYAPIRLSPEERKEWEVYADYIFAREKSRSPQPGVRMPEPVLAKIPAVKPALRDLFADRDGRVWLDTYTTAEKRNIPPRPSGDARPQITWRERSTYDVFANSGQYLGHVTLPAEHQLLDARGDRVWTLTHGPDDEDRIVVFHIVRK